VLRFQIARFQSDRTGDLCRQLLDHGGSSQPPATEEEESKEVIKVSSTAAAPQSFTHSDVEQSAPVMFASNPTQSLEDPRKTAAAAVVAKLTASTSSAEMLSYVLSSLASEGIIGNNNPPAVTETLSSVDFPPEKRPKLQNHDQSYLSPHHQNTATTSSSTPPQPLPPPPPFQLQPQFLQPLQPPGPVNHTPFNYTIATSTATTQQQQQEQGPWVPGLTQLSTTSAPSENSYQKFQGQDGFYGINSSVPITPVTRQ